MQRHSTTMSPGLGRALSSNGDGGPASGSEPLPLLRSRPPEPAAGVAPQSVVSQVGGPQDGAVTTLASLADVELLEAFRARHDEAAFAELYRRHKAEIYTYCLRMMAGDRDKASDVFQEVFIKAFEKSSQFREGTNVVGWIYMIARNLCLNTIRNERPTESLDSQETLVSIDRSLAPEYDEEQHFLRRKLEEALATLPVEFREPFILREFDGFTYREIAEMTGTTLGMTKVRIYRAKQRMRELLSPMFG